MMQQEKKKVLIGITKATWGGAQRYVYDLATSLPKDEFLVSVLAGEEGLLARRLRSAGIPIQIIHGLQRDMRWLGELSILFRLYAAIREERPDILHLNSAKMAGLGGVAGRLLGIPKIVITIHGWAFREDRMLAIRGVIWLFEWLTALLAHITIVISETDRQAAENMPFVRSKARLIHIGIQPSDLPRQTESREKLKEILRGRRYEKLTGLEEAIWIGAVGELNHNKDFLTLVRAFARISERAILIIIGEGRERSKLEEEIKKLGLVNRVIMPGFIGGRESRLEEIYPAFSLFAMTSTKEGLPYVLLEAGLAGLPVVATEVGGIPDVIANQKNGLLVRPKDIAGVRDAIAAYLANESIRQGLGSALRQTVLTEFSAARMVESTRICYQSR